MIANDLTFTRMGQENISFVATLEKRFFTTPWDEQALEKGLKNNSEIFWLVQVKGINVGYIGFAQTFESADILTVCVDPAYRRMGCAEALLRHCLDQMYDNGVEKVFLEVRESNDSARSLYEKAGFCYLNKRINYYRDPVEDAFVMIKEMRK